jgi:hypothetical protein
MKSEVIGVTCDTIAVILGGGKGERLYPLTKHRAKPAVPIAGKFREGRRLSTCPPAYAGEVGNGGDLRELFIISN